ncbi:hypothetical protein RF11_06369 [Thelohanellus kitauei]|uniref:Reverse transcriptase domain-containing protein n=1 Tax=Thelohanellus kitauei TaxID=669202 RepID=A0A0C2J584_THEKT|nr:hypothetical protein RF11_06369 [Thelohanellus kitauei]
MKRRTYKIFSSLLKTTIYIVSIWEAANGKNSICCCCGKPFQYEIDFESGVANTKKGIKAIDEVGTQEGEVKLALHLGSGTSSTSDDKPQYASTKWIPKNRENTYNGSRYKNTNIIIEIAPGTGINVDKNGDRLMKLPDRGKFSRLWAERIRTGLTDHLEQLENSNIISHMSSRIKLHHFSPNIRNAINKTCKMEMVHDIKTQLYSIFSQMESVDISHVLLAIKLSISSFFRKGNTTRGQQRVDKITKEFMDLDHQDTHIDPTRITTNNHSAFYIEINNDPKPFIYNSETDPNMIKIEASSSELSISSIPLEKNGGDLGEHIKSCLKSMNNDQNFKCDKCKTELPMNFNDILFHSIVKNQDFQDTDDWHIPKCLPKGRPIISCSRLMLSTTGRYSMQARGIIIIIFMSAKVDINNILKLQVLNDKNSHFIKSSSELIQRMTAFTLPDSVEFITADISKLYLNIDINIVCNKVYDLLVKS